MNSGAMQPGSRNQAAAAPSGRQYLSANPGLESDCIHVWTVPIPGLPEVCAELRAYLSADELARLERYYYRADQNRSLVSRGALRAILGHYLGMMPGAVQFLTLRHGKPALAGESGLYFNLAHSAGMALVAITRVGEIGVDIERVRQVNDLENLARTCFSAAEYRKFCKLPDPDKQQVFFTTWARKEAFIKATGDGLSYPLDQFEVSLLPDEPARLLEIGGNRVQAESWTLRDIPVADGYAAAFAVEAQPVRISHIKFFEWWREHEQF